MEQKILGGNWMPWLEVYPANGNFPGYGKFTMLRLGSVDNLDLCDLNLKIYTNLQLLLKYQEMYTDCLAISLHLSSLSWKHVFTDVGNSPCWVPSGNKIHNKKHIGLILSLCSSREQTSKSFRIQIQANVYVCRHLVLLRGNFSLLYISNAI